MAGIAPAYVWQFGDGLTVPAYAGVKVCGRPSPASIPAASFLRRGLSRASQETLTCPTRLPAVDPTRRPAAARPADPPPSYTLPIFISRSSQGAMVRNGWFAVEGTKFAAVGDVSDSSLTRCVTRARPYTYCTLSLLGTCARRSRHIVPADLWRRRIGQQDSLEGNRDRHLNRGTRQEQRAQWEPARRPDLLGPEHQHRPRSPLGPRRGDPGRGPHAQRRLRRAVRDRDAGRPVLGVPQGLRVPQALRRVQRRDR